MLLKSCLHVHHPAAGGDVVEMYELALVEDEHTLVEDFHAM